MGLGRAVRSVPWLLRLERDFIHTARFSGEGTVQIVITEILPYALTWSLSNFMNATLSAIGSESSLAVLGLSPANLVSLGNMLQWARERNAIFNGQWLLDRFSYRSNSCTVCRLVPAYHRIQRLSIQ